MLAMVVSACATGQTPVSVDGVFNEWQAGDLISTDPSGDSSGNFDVTEIWARSEGTKLFLRFTTATTAGPDLNLPSGSAGDGSLVIRVGYPGGSISTDFRSRRLFLNDNSGNTTSWNTVDFHTAPTFAAHEFEMQLDLGPLGVNQGDALAISASGSDSVASASFTMAVAAIAPSRGSSARDPNIAFRLASMNTKVNGLLNGSREPKLSRVIDAMDAEVYCFQEETTASEGQIQSVLNAADPLETGASWIAHKNNDQFVAVDSSVGTLIPVPENDNNYASAVVDFGNGDAVIVFSIHPKCCGFIGSTEDAQRISQMNLLLSVLSDFRAGNLGGTLAAFANAPAIIVGDWNLVGSRAPLDLLLAPAPPAMVEVPLSDLIGEETITWIGASQGAGSFWPGRLDLLVHDNTGLSTLNAFAFDSRSLNAGELAALGLQSGDSGGTDHRMVVADFSFGVVVPPCTGDADGSGSVDFGDITNVLGNFLASGCPAGSGTCGSTGVQGDANNDGLVNFSDVTAILGNWLGVCP